MRLLKYEPSMRADWDEFVGKSKNATFLLKRDYMEYHSDRFCDHSMAFVGDDGRFVALLPANIEGDTLYSHKGLTYGGILMSDKTSGGDLVEMFALMKEQLPSFGIRKLIYKAIPHIYHRQPSEEDLYALFRFDAKLTIRNLSTVIDMRQPMRSSRLGKRAVKRQKHNNVEVLEIDTVSPFWDIVVHDRRERHNVKPVHTAEELNYLKSKFPENIRIYVALVPEGVGSDANVGQTDDYYWSDGRKIVGGAVIYLDKDVIHLQYAACTHEGKDLYATDVIYHELIFNIYPQANYFDFGISNEDAGRYLNLGMVAHKEEFGGRSVVYDTYELDL